MTVTKKTADSAPQRAHGFAPDDLRKLWASSRMMQMGLGAEIGGPPGDRHPEHFWSEMNPCTFHFPRPCGGT